jgi:hypothetical protein
MVCIHNSIRSYVEQEITCETTEFNDSLVLYYTLSTKQQRNLSKTFTIDSFRPPALLLIKMIGCLMMGPYKQSLLPLVTNCE